MSKITKLADIEIQAKIGAAIVQEAQKGKALSDFGAKESAAIAGNVMSTFSPAAQQQLIRSGVEHLVRFVLGEKIAERVWAVGKGWSMPKTELMAIIRDMRFEDPEDGFACVTLYRDQLPDLTEEELPDHSMFARRFMPLFLAQPKGATLREVATKKAMSGDKLALSFLAWKEV